MTALGQLLTLLHDSDQRVRSFEGEIRDWAQPAPSNALVVERDTVSTGRLRWAGGGPFPRARKTYRRVWCEPGEGTRVRVELLRGNSLVCLAVRNGWQWWRWDERHGVSNGSVETAHSRSGFPPLLTPMFLSSAVFVGQLRFAPPRSSMRLGREVFVVHARPRGPLPGSGELEFEFEFDAATGTTLRRATFEDGRCVRLMEVRAAQFDAQIDRERFIFIPPERGGRISLAPPNGRALGC